MAKPKLPPPPRPTQTSGEFQESPDPDTLPDDEEGKPPPYGRPRPIKERGDVPRVVDQLDRAPRGLVRYKVMCRNYLPQDVRYILAEPGQAEAVKAHYLEVSGLDRLLEKLAKKKNITPEGPDLNVTELPD